MNLDFITDFAKKISLDKNACEKAMYEIKYGFDEISYIVNSASLNNIAPFLSILKKDRKRGAIQSLAAVLVISEDTYIKYTERCIPDSVFYDTMSDISVWVNNAKYEEKVDGILEISWIRHCLYMNIFKIGRLQYQFYKTDYLRSGFAFSQIKKAPIKNKSNVLNIHIPQGKKLSYSECEKSLKNSRAFFSEYFPEYDYEGFVCDSWLLDPKNNRFMDPNSNIIAFSGLFDNVFEIKKGNREIVRRLWGKQNENLPLSCLAETTDLQKRTKEYLINSGKTGNGYGFIIK